MSPDKRHCEDCYESGGEICSMKDKKYCIVFPQSKSKNQMEKRKAEKETGDNFSVYDFGKGSDE